METDGHVTADAGLVAALRLMRLALALLDRAGCSLAAARLQHAIDAVRESQDVDPSFGLE